ncbi:LysR family transcriptional regulator [Streptomyces abyssalis]|uniref:LysR family transcriptional regulator n=1 Tax=Streptomyces abyssalis TaxID=933944 RepID=A0A1E7JPT2_9ACTN|nr:LysR family transcriptional regulator [Streptomyces abyssalis]OEU95024.1 LysR family transcriptional regulator [Streptomyces abyssalis]
MRSNTHRRRSMPIRHRVTGVDLVGACRAFVSVSEHGSFTVGADAARMSQSVASRRVAALEERFGEQLFERTSRRAVLTSFGRDLLPTARQLVQAADVLLHEAESAKRKPWRLAMPAVCPTAGLARLVAEARAHAVTLEVRVATPAQRQETVHARQPVRSHGEASGAPAGRVHAALLAVPPGEATWSVPLGLAGAQDPGVRRLYVETLRPGRTTTGPAARIWIQPEDDVPHIRDPLTRLRDAVGLRPAQLTTTNDLAHAAAEVLCTPDLLLCSPAQAEEFGLDWRPIGEITLRRGYALATADGRAQHIEARLGEALARCLGARSGTGTTGDATAGGTGT